MDITTRSELIQHGFNLGSQLDNEIRRLNRRPIPDHWSTLLRSHSDIRSIVKTVARFDDRADETLRALLATPVGDTTATTVITAGLLRGVIQRNRNRPERVADIITELTVHVASRPSINPERRATTVCLDVAQYRLTRASKNQQRYDETKCSLPSGINGTLVDSAENVAMTNLHLAEIESVLHRVSPRTSLSGVVRLASLKHLSDTERQRLSRNRRRLRPIVEASFADAA